MYLETMNVSGISQENSMSLFGELFCFGNGTQVSFACDVRYKSVAYLHLFRLSERLRQ